MTVPDVRQYHPIRLDTLVPDSVPEFDLYLRTGEDAYILFRERHQRFNVEHRSKLLSNSIEELFIREEDQRSYGYYLEKNIANLISNPRLPSAEKASVIYSVAKTVLIDAYENPRARDLLRRTQCVTQPTVDFILKGKESVQNLISIMSYDYYTFTHSVNVCVFSVALATQYGVRSQSGLHELAAGALLHDVGKSQIPKSLLNKPGKLTPEEFSVMKGHVEIGENLLSDKPGMTPKVLLPVSLHHEKMNASGYPRSLSGESLHLFGRIASIADCFDAMTTNRAYQPAMDAFTAICLMKGKLRDHFDQDLLENFILLLEETK
ncbi:MAG: HD domain-containing phosphohydrolase [Acidobacteriota bacterium]